MPTEEDLFSIVIFFGWRFYDTCVCCMGMEKLIM